MFGYESRDDGDIARALAEALRGELSRRSGLTLIDPGQRIRATVIGASQFTVQVSGKTIHLPQARRAAGAQRAGDPCAEDVKCRRRDLPPPARGGGSGRGDSGKGNPQCAACPRPPP